MELLPLPISIIVLHFFADFVFQSNWMALNKSKNNVALATHVYAYAFVMSVGFGLIFPMQHGMSYIYFFLATFISHFITDYVTSRMTSRLWFIKFGHKTYEGPRFSHFEDVSVDTSKRHWFFVAIGWDQAVHYYTLALTLWWLNV